MFNKKEFDEFIGEVSYLNESAKSLIAQIKEADGMSVNLKGTLEKLETVSQSLNYQISKTLDENINGKLEVVVNERLKELVDESKGLRDISISISQSIDFMNKTSKKIEVRQKYHLLESLLYIAFFITGLFIEHTFNVWNF